MRKKRGARAGEIPRNRRGAAVTSVHALCDVARALVKDAMIYIKIVNVEVQVGWNEKVFTQTDSAKLEASASGWHLIMISQKMLYVNYPSFQLYKLIFVLNFSNHFPKYKNSLVYGGHCHVNEHLKFD